MSASHAALCALALLPAPAAAQWAVQLAGRDTEFRGLSAANENVVWAGGRGGVFATTSDGGRTWTVDTVPGATNLFFIDAHAVDAETAYLLGTAFDGTPLARVYRTDDGGATWRRVHEDTRPGTFYDGFAFWDAWRGVAYGDAVDGALVVARTDDGETWSVVAPAALPPALQGEAGFAASGTAIVTDAGGRAWFGSGGAGGTRVYRSADGGRTWATSPVDIPATASSGIYGLTFADSLTGYALAGDHQDPHAPGDNLFATTDGGATWTAVGRTQPARGLYGMARVPGLPGALVAVGPPGSGYSVDGGRTWRTLDATPFSTVTFVSPAAGWAAGTGGRIARWTGEFTP